MKRFAGRIVWITGAGTGIGRATALRLAGEGATTVLTGRRAQPIEAVAAEIRALGGQAQAIAADVADSAVVHAVVDDIARQYGRIDIYVGAAGFNVPERSFATLSSKNADAIINANLNGAFHASAAVLAVMRPRRDGLLIHIASWSGKRVAPWSGPAYTASKAGLIALSESINLEVARDGIRSTVISPGGINTPLLDKLPEPPPPEVRAKLLQAEDCADLIAYIGMLPAHVRIDDVMITPTVQGA